MGITGFILSTIILQLAVQSEATRCLKCDNIPSPHVCTVVTNCNADEYCLTEQLVTPTGNIEYNVGCVPKGRCASGGSSLVGKRSSNFTERASTSITTCLECCMGDFCNNEGCGIQAIPLGQRGPYCFNCDTTLDPNTCDKLAVCDTTEICLNLYEECAQQMAKVEQKEHQTILCGGSEECMLYSPPEFGGLPQTVYRSQCQNKAACAVLAQTVTNSNCNPTCCSTDFCNNQCVITQSTPIHVPTQPTTVPQLGSCKTGHYLDDITGMCIFIDESRSLDYADAKRACENMGDHLVTIDTHEKMIFIETTILHHSGYSSDDDRNYYIGLTDTYDTSTFYWEDGRKLLYENWGGGDEIASNQQPDDDAAHPQNCVLIYGKDHYRWHDDSCSNKWHYICEDRSFLGHPGGHTTGAGTTAPSTTFHCDTHGGYMHLHNAHAHLCVHIHTNHANWNGARAQCQAEGGDLVILDNSDKAALMRNEANLHAYSGQQGYWIGASDLHYNNQFVWVNGQKVTYGDWHTGQPNHHDGGHDQNCACLWSSREHFQWHDDYCPKGLGFICEKR